MGLPGPPEVTDLFRVAVRAWIPAGMSGNQMLQTARELGFGVRRSSGLDIIRSEREAGRQATEAGQAFTEIAPFLPEREYKWGNLVQETGEFLRFDGPHALLFQIGGEAGDNWLDYVILPEDSGAETGRFVTEEDEASDPNDTRNGPFYRTTDTFEIGEHPGAAARRLLRNPERVVRVIYNLP